MGPRLPTPGRSASRPGPRRAEGTARRVAWLTSQRGETTNNTNHTNKDRGQKTSADDAFVFKSPGATEVDQQAEAQAGGLEVIVDLGPVAHRSEPRGP